MKPPKPGSFSAMTPREQMLGGSGWTSNPLANSNSRAAIDSMGPDLVERSMLFADGADHDRLRGSVRDVFTRSFITGLTAGVEAIATAVIDHPSTATAFDFMADIALPLPIAVAGEWLGLDSDSAALLREESPAIIRMLGALADPDDIAAGAAAFASLVTEFLPLAADRRTHPAMTCSASSPPIRISYSMMSSSPQSSLRSPATKPRRICWARP